MSIKIPAMNCSHTNIKMAALKGEAFRSQMVPRNSFSNTTLFRHNSLRGEFELPTAGDVEWLPFSYT